MGTNKQRVEVRKPVSCCMMGLVSGICLDTCFFLASYLHLCQIHTFLKYFIKSSSAFKERKGIKEMLVVLLILNLQLSFPASGDRKHSQGGLHAPRMNIPALYV